MGETMTKTELEHWRRRLLALKKRLGADLSQLEEEALRPLGGESGGSLSDVPVHPADLGTENYDVEVGLELMENEAQILKEIDDALARIDQGTYGICENCHREISKERLEAVPYARYCIRCARKFQGQASQ
jgi:DnaK suppressor protein